MFLHGFLYVWLIFPHKVDFHPHSRQQLLLCKKENRGNDELPVLLLKIYKKTYLQMQCFVSVSFDVRMLQPPPPYMLDLSEFSTPSRCDLICEHMR